MKFKHCKNNSEYQKPLTVLLEYWVYFEMGICYQYVTLTSRYNILLGNLLIMIELTINHSLYGLENQKLIVEGLSVNFFNLENLELKAVVK